MTGDWSDSTKWKMDLVKSAVTFTVAALVSLVVFDKIQEWRVERKARADAFYAARLKSLEELRSATVAYDLAAHTAYTDLYEWKTRIKTASMLRYEQDSYPRWVLSLETVQLLFPTSGGDVQRLVENANERHKVYDTFVDKRLDNQKNIAKIDPWAGRADFNKLSKTGAELRAGLIAKLQASLFPTAGQ